MGGSVFDLFSAFFTHLYPITVYLTALGYIVGGARRVRGECLFFSLFFGVPGFCIFLSVAFGSISVYVGVLSCLCGEFLYTSYRM